MAKKRTIFIIMEKGTEYNDSTYDILETGEPKKAFSTRSAAEDKLEELNEAALAKLDTYTIQENGGRKSIQMCYIKEVEVDETQIVSKSYATIQKEVAALKKQAQLKAREILEGSIRELFATYPNMEAIRWEQYTPYFNDGDTCEFSVNEPRVKFAGMSDEDGDYADGFISRYDTDDDKAKKAILTKVESVFSSLDDDDLETMYGDHVQITIDRNMKTEVDEHEHD